jgi:hypothetical protein
MQEQSENYTYRLDSIQPPSGVFPSRESVRIKTGYSPPFTADALLGFLPPYGPPPLNPSSSLPVKNRCSSEESGTFEIFSLAGTYF